MKDNINKDSVIPYYKQLADILERKIKEGYFKDGKLYSEGKISDIFNVNIGTTRKALTQLKHKDLIYKRKGLGSFIKKKKFDIDLTKFIYLGNILKEKGYEQELNIIFKKIIKFNNKYFNNYKIKRASDRIINFKRVRIINNKPICIEEFFFNYDKCSSINEKESTKIYSYLTDDLNINITNVNQYIEPVILSKEESKLLEVKENPPALLLSEFAFSNNDLWIFYCKTTIRGDICRYYLRINGNKTK